MKSSPQLRKSRPQVPPAELKRLAELDEWTTLPEQGRAELTQAPGGPQEPANEGQGPEAAAGVPELATGPKMPWEDVAPGMTKPYSIILPAEIYLKVKWIGETTYDSSMRQFVLSALRRAIDEEFKERKL